MNSMTLRELIDRLEEAAEEYGDDAEVRLMTQQNWPFENAIRGVTCSAVLKDFDDDDNEEADDAVGEEEAADPIVYIVEGKQLCYGNKDAWDACY